ncbi:hypothetical protein [Streptomyces sp. NPDC058625]|uniref:hypothetical protein n=1 Tax=Streptomyces sp. NPDC058625 TaxID=3346564 RepID=UPI00365A1EC2
MSDPAADRHRPRRRGRTTLMIATAAVLGLVAGTCTGYLVQADREPTALPPLSQPVIEQAKGKGPAPLPAARDRRLKTDGDLRKLLLKKPRGAREEDLLSDDGWMSLADYAGYFDEPDEALHNFILDGFRRAATISWQQDDTHVEIRLIQFRQEGEAVAEGHAANNQRWARIDGGDEREVPGTTTGTAFVHAEVDEEPGYLPVYTAQAHGWRGDISMEVWVTGAERIPEATILDLAERQMERL